MSKLDQLKAAKRTIIDRHVRPDNRKAFFQVFNTLLPIALLWWAIAQSAVVSYWLTAALVLLMGLLLLRVFVLMHECGHGSLFRTQRLNRTFGFLFGVISGMPQFVWSERHQYHHSTNGNWEKYRGPLCIVSVDDFAAMTPQQQRKYARQRSIWMAPLAGFIYVVFNPRINWLRGSIALLMHTARGKPPSSFKTNLWATPQEYWHMFWNNVVLIAVACLMSWWIGTALFLVSAVASMSLAGAGGILLFTVQHNFEHAYASGDEGWDYYEAALDGTSFLELPGWLNWLTANIAYHHIHHMSARIPNYCLIDCHREFAELFTDVKRIRLAQIPASLKFILWDTRSRCICSVAEYRRGLAIAAAMS